jgi:hypothetical protein
MQRRPVIIKKTGQRAARSRERCGLFDYFSEVLIVVKFELSWVPTPCTAVMIAIAIPAAISPYSIAVAPDSSSMNFKISVFMFGPALILIPWNKGYSKVPSAKLRNNI